MDPNAAVKNIIAAHGGEDIWTGIEALEAEISTSGLLFKFKRRPVLDHVRVTAYAHEPRFVFHDFPSAGLSGELAGDREVRIVSQSGKIVQKREAPPSGISRPASDVLLRRSGFHLFWRLCHLELSGCPFFFHAGRISI
jgi:hypothetical protein